VKSIKILIGELQGADVEVLRFAIDELKKGTPLEGAEILFETEKAEFRCRVCGKTWSLEETPFEDENIRECVHFVPEVAHAFIRCPACSSTDFEVVRGRGVKIGAVE